MSKDIENMLDTIRTEAKYTASYTGREAFDKRVMQAIQAVDRAAFVPSHYKKQAYDNSPLVIGHGQTISQPYIVALMTDLLDLTPKSIVLEIGTGSGYQTAILARLAQQIFTIERIPELADSSKQRLKELGYQNVEVRCDDGYYGWKEKAPFDAIIVTAAATHMPQNLLDQLKSEGRMIIPIGLPYMHQELMLVTKDKTGKIKIESVLDVAFVPLIVEDRTVSN